MLAQRLKSEKVVGYNILAYHKVIEITMLNSNFFSQLAPRSCKNQARMIEADYIRLINLRFNVFLFGCMVDG